jgi:hypothetical protein
MMDKSFHAPNKRRKITRDQKDFRAGLHVVDAIQAIYIP